MTDKIMIRDLFLRTIIGVNDEERNNRQDVLLNITLHADTRRAGQTDSITDAVNYRTVTKEVIELVETSRFFLVEKLADEVAKKCLEFEHVQRVEVSVEKPMALRFARTVGIAIDRERTD